MPTPILLRANNITIPAVLNDTIAAKEFKKHLPFFGMGRKSEFDYCCLATCGIFDPAETQTGWKNGDIGYSRGWFAIFHSGEEKSLNYANEMIIGHIDDNYISTIRNFPDSIKISVELDKSFTIKSQNNDKAIF